MVSRLLLCVFFALVATAVASAAPRATTDLNIVVWPHSTGGTGVKRWTLRCGPVGGTLPHAARACRKLAPLARPFAPVPAGVACSDVYSGPQVARVQGTFRGRRVSAMFKRTDSCETARWARVGFLFPIRIRSHS